MQPTIGRIVHYEHEGQTLAAIVTNVVGENIVNLQIFKDGLGGCYFHEGVEMGEGEGQWRWPLVVTNVPTVNATTTMPSGGTNAPIIPPANIPVTNNPVTVPQGTGTGVVAGTPLVSSSLPSVSKP